LDRRDRARAGGGDADRARGRHCQILLIVR
jgi:hypothetical protein